ncbi:MAG: cell wall metabolism sensor histidine kinase WalK [Ignavibacteria bacterium]|nr:cell wall metabolism sensor histidine kinase WalK [Ignavibacteria bacterium]
MRSLGYKIGFGYFVLVCISLTMSIIAVYNFSRLGTSVAAMLSETTQSATAAENMVKVLDEQENARYAMLIDDPEYYVFFREGIDRFAEVYERAKDAIKSPRQAALLDSIALIYVSYLTVTDSLYQTLQLKRRSPMPLLYQRFVVRPVAQSLRDKCFELLEANQDEMLIRENRIRSVATNTTFTLIFAALASIALSVVASIRFTRMIVRPAEKLTRTVRSISRGHLTQKIDIVTDDEIGELSQEFNKMTERLREYEAMNVHQLISEKKKSEAIVASIPDPLIVADEDGQLLLMNQAAKRTLNIIGNNWQGKSLHEVVNNARWLQLLSPEEAPQENQEAREPLLVVEREDQTLYFRPRHTSIVDEHGKVQGVVTLLQDVTRFKVLDRMKSEFMAAVSHELRTPLTSISMAIDIMSQEVLGKVNDRQKDLLSTAKDDCERLTKLVRELLDLSRLESGKYEMRRAPVNLRSLIDEALKPLRLQFKEKGIQLEMDVSPATPDVAGDEQQLSRVITNLASNALRYTPPNGKVTIRCSIVNDAVQISVADSGRGIPADAIEMIFDKFVQVKQASDSLPGSVGLGLAIAKEVVEAHGGKIWVESAVEKGSTFYFTIPRL